MPFPRRSHTDTPDTATLKATLSDELSEGIGQAGRQIARTGRTARAVATNAAINAVRGNPLTAPEIAVGVGLLLGRATRKG